MVERIAHRGASREAPENTIPAIRLAVEKYQVDRVEIDLRLTSEGIPVVFHDRTLERTTEEHGTLREFSLAKLQALDAGFWFDPQGRKEFPRRGKEIRIPTLEEVLIQFPETNFCLEIKDREILIVEKVLEVLRRISRKGVLLVGSFDRGITQALRRLAGPSFEGIFSQPEVLQAYLAFRLGKKGFSPPSRYAFLPQVRYGLRLDGERWIDFLHQKGMRIFYWTVNEIDEMRLLLKKGADGILTDDPGKLNQLF